MSRLIHISEAASLAIHSLALIASSKMRLNAKKIAGILHVSQNHLAKILQVLENNCPFISCIFGGKPDKLTNEFVEYLTNTKISDLKTKDINYA